MVDELHMVGDGARGLALETTLTKLLFHPDARGVQIVGMSATAGGLETLADWLRARLFLTNFRPVPLKEHAVFGGQVFELVGSLVTTCCWLDAAAVHVHSHSLLAGHPP